MINQANKLEYELSDSTENRSRTHRKIWEETDVYNDILKTIFHKSQSILQQENISIVDAWLVKYDSNASMHWHDHLPRHYSFIYYIQNSIGSPFLEFEDGLSFDGYEDHLIFFPSYLKHRVVHRESTNPRLALVGNLVC
jgi:hypothetical protein